MGHEVLDTLPFPRSQSAQSGLTLTNPTGSGDRISQISSAAADTATSPLYDNGTSAGSAGNSSAKFRPDLAGKIYSVRDTKNGTGQPMLLRAVQLETAITVGAALAVLGPGRALQFDTTYGRDGVVAKAASSAATVGKPLDDSYPVGAVLAYGDWVFVVEEGPCSVPILTGQTVTVGKEAACHSDGTFRDAAGGETVVGRWLSRNVGASDSTRGVLFVRRGVNADKGG